MFKERKLIFFDSCPILTIPFFVFVAIIFMGIWLQVSSLKLKMSTEVKKKNNNF